MCSVRLLDRSVQEVSIEAHRTIFDPSTPIEVYRSVQLLDRRSLGDRSLGDRNRSLGDMYRS